MAASGATLIFPLLFMTQGCASDSVFARFAPPGVVKYEDIASEKPPNPAIQETVREYRDTTRRRFPVLSRTPTAEPPPQMPDAAVREALRAGLVEGREALAARLADDQAAIAAERGETGEITEEGEAFNAQLKRDAAAAQAERRDALSADDAPSGARPSDDALSDGAHSDDAPPDP